jgi:hypothetical protein
MLSMQKEGAAYRNIRDIAVRCTFMLSFNSQSTNPSVAGQVLGALHLLPEVILFEFHFINRGTLQ